MSSVQPGHVSATHDHQPLRFEPSRGGARIGRAGLLPSRTSVSNHPYPVLHTSLTSFASSHWYYEDFIREQHPSKFPSYTLKTFSEALFHACPLLAHWAKDHDQKFASFMQYKTRVPVCGAIMLNDTWDKVRRSTNTSDSLAYVRLVLPPTAVHPSEGVEIISGVGIPKGQNQRAGA